jgi:hypothetical protein
MSETTTKRPVGSRVSVDHPKYPGVWIVKSNGPANASLEPEAGGRGLKCPHTMLLDPIESGAADGLRVVPVPTVEWYSEGELVLINGGKFVGVWVVLKDGGEKVNLAKLGGDNGKYLRATKRGLARVSLAEVLTPEALASLK